MNLDGEPFSSVKQLDEQGKVWRWVGNVFVTKYQCPMLCPEVMKGFPLEWTIVNYTLGLFSIYHLPEFANRGACWN